MTLSKALKKLRCQRILALGPHVVGQDDHLFLMTDVFPSHEDWPEKFGCGVRNIEVRRHGAYKSCGFILIRTDGSEIDISYKVSLDGKGTVYGRFVRAARTEIMPQAYAWKQANPAPFAGLQCDHVAQFDAILRVWLSAVDLRPEEVAVTSNLVGHTDLFMSRDLAISWHRFHERQAAYQWLTAEDNSRKSNTRDAGHDEWLAEYDAAVAP